ncbi:lytic transglycosylase domain-containing protein [Occallatibacter savannae]|uniref:lytic transglycosylase domain-containing protein n=1 Tax=Occallatibacter savannae TaxID=1002691 RepID=UPI001EF4EED1|nr:lytic transglycosylase domain-containing protein [Occallatibacter savannae]
MKLAPQLVITAIAVAAPIAATAAERVHLANGFDMRCDHHAEVGSVVRLYMSHGESSFIEMKPAEITSYETVPDPPAPAASAPEARTEARLTPADLHLMLADAGEQHNVDADLLASIVKAESNGNARAVSHAGARGLMQLMPGTAADLGVDDSFAPDQNVRGGSAYLDELLNRYHDNIALALAAYNAGPAAVDKYHGIPPYHETRAYVARVIHEFNRRVIARQREAARELQRARTSAAISAALQASSSR